MSPRSCAPGSLCARVRRARATLPFITPTTTRSRLSQVNEGVVLAVGPGRRTREGEVVPVSVKEGDKVLLPEYGGSLVKMDNKE